MKLSLRTIVLACVLGTSTGRVLLACADDAAEPSAAADASADGQATLEAGPVHVDASSSDAEDELTVPNTDVVCEAGPCAVALSGAGASFCALLRDGRVACWGQNDRGQLGYDSDAALPRANGHAVAVPGVASATHVSVGGDDVCARIDGGAVVCWGAADLVNAGVIAADAGSDADPPPVVDSLGPTAQTAVPAAVSVAVGAQTACVTSTTGALTCWGENDHLELGRGATAAMFAPPANVDLGAQVALVPAPAAMRTYAITKGGALLSWGASNGAFLLGRDTSEDPDPLPAAVPALANVRAIASSAAHACAVAGRFVTCWGANDLGQLGRGTFGPLAFLPAPSNLQYVVATEDRDAGIAQSTDVTVDVAVGGSHSCAAMGSGRVYCWGANGSGQLGDGLAADHSGVPRRIFGLSGPAVRLAANNDAVCALLRNGAVECWGANFAGQLGRGTLDSRPHPEPASVPLP